MDNVTGVRRRMSPRGVGDSARVFRMSHRFRDRQSDSAPQKLKFARSPGTCIIDPNGRAEGENTEKASLHPLNGGTFIQETRVPVLLRTKRHLLTTQVLQTKLDLVCHNASKRNAVLDTTERSLLDTAGVNTWTTKCPDWTRSCSAGVSDQKHRSKHCSINS